MPTVLLTIWGFLRSVSPRTYLEIGLALAISLFAAWVLRVNDLRGHYKAEVVTLQRQVKDDDAAYAKLVTDTRTAQAAADAAWQAKIDAKEETYHADAQAADGRYADLRKQYAAAILRARAAAGGGGAGGHAAHAAGGGAGVPQGAPALPQLCVSDDDAAKIADLQAYAQSCYEWAQGIEKANGER